MQLTLLCSVILPRGQGWVGDREKVKGCPMLSVRFVLESNLRLPGSPYTFSYLPQTTKVQV